MDENWRCTRESGPFSDDLLVQVQVVNIPTDMYIMCFFCVLSRESETDRHHFFVGVMNMEAGH